MEFLLSALLTGLILALFRVSPDSAIFSPLAIILYVATLIPLVILFDSVRNRLNQYLRRQRYRARKNLERNHFLNAYSKHLKKYYKKHEMRFELNNDNVILKVLSYSQKTASFYCLNKKSEMGYLERLIFNSQTDVQAITIFWTILDMEFKEGTTFQDIIDLVISTHMGNLMRKVKRVKPINGKTYELHFILRENPCLCCYKKTKHQKKLKKGKKHTQEYFIVKADIKTIYDIYCIVRYEYMHKHYEDLYEILSQRKDCEIESSVYKPKEKAVSDNLIDINNASETELSKLSGINIILAKRIIQQREFIDGFKSKEEFFEFCNLKSHFVKQIEPLIAVGEFDIIETILQRFERTVDAFDEDEDYINYDVQDDDDNIIVDF